MFDTYSQEKIHDVLTELERSLIETCCEYMQSAKFAVVQVQTTVLLVSRIIIT